MDHCNATATSHECISLGDSAKGKISVDYELLRSMGCEFRFRILKAARPANCQKVMICCSKCITEASSHFRGQTPGDRSSEPCQQNKFES